MDVNEKIERHSQLEARDSTWRLKVADIADVIRPLRSEVRGKFLEGSKRMQKIYDATALQANNNLGTALWGNATNSSDVWFMIGTEDADLNKWPKARSALATYSRRTLASFGPSWCNFYGEAFSSFLDFAAFGEFGWYDEMKQDHSGFIDQVIPLSQYTYDLASDGMLGEFYRCWEMSLPSAAKMFGKEKLSEKSQLRLAGANPGNYMVQILHSVCPDALYAAGRLGQNSKPFESSYIQVEDKHEIQVKGYEEMPFFVPPWERAAGERRARGAGEYVLPDANSSQVMTKANLKAGVMQGDPPWGGPNEGTIQAIRLQPGKVIPGAITQNGNQLLKPLITGGGTPFSADQAKDLRQQIKEGFYYTLLSTIGPGRTGLAPEEVLLITEQQNRMMGPYLSNIQTHWLSPLVQRRFRMLAQEGIFKDVSVPKELQGRKLHVKFVSPMALAQKAAKAANAIRAAKAIGEVGQFAPAVYDKFNEDNFVDTINEGFGVPELTNDDDVTQNKRAARTQAQAQQGMAETAATAADAANKGAGALAQLKGAGVNMPMPQAQPSP